jgi:hypothetical protein
MNGVLPEAGPDKQVRKNTWSIVSLYSINIMRSGATIIFHGIGIL